MATGQLKKRRSRSGSVGELRRVSEVVLPALSTHDALINEEIANCIDGLGELSINEIGALSVAGLGSRQPRAAVRSPLKPLYGSDHSKPILASPPCLHGLDGKCPRHTCL